MKIVFQVFFIFLFFNKVFAQIGGLNTLATINVPANASIAASNGIAATTINPDLGVGLYNPALLNKKNNLALLQSFNNNYFSTLSGQSAVGFTIKNKVNLSAAATYNNYGTFQYANAAGELNGLSFSANDLLLQLGGQTLFRDSVFSIGTNLKYYSSTLEALSINAFAVDIAGAYINKKSNFIVSALIRNAGFVNSNGVNDNLTLPFDVQIGLSKKLKHAPFRFFLTTYQLNKYNLIATGTYVTSDTSTIKSGFNQRNVLKQVDNLFRHTNLGVEVIGKYFSLTASYNHLRQRELAYAFKGSLAGLAFGAQIRTNYFSLGMAYNNFNASANNWLFSLGLNLGNIISKKSS